MIKAKKSVKMKQEDISYFFCHGSITKHENLIFFEYLDEEKIDILHYGIIDTVAKKFKV